MVLRDQLQSLCLFSGFNKSETGMVPRLAAPFPLGMEIAPLSLDGLMECLAILGGMIEG